MNLKQLVFLISCILGFAACTEPVVEPTGTYDNGIFTVNEGVWGQSSGTISYFNRNTKSTQDKIFQAANNRDLGEVVQSMFFYNNKVYIVVNNSNKIEVANASTFKEEAQITGLKMPRYFLAVSATKGYVSEWGTDGLTGTISVLDLTTNSITNTIPVGAGPEALLLKDGKLYVAHIGGFGLNNIVTVINTTTDQVITSIPVLDNPSSCVEDVDGNIWVACSGELAYSTYPNIDTANSTESGLVKISPSNHTALDTISFGKGNPISKLIINSNTQNELYYSRAGTVWEYNIATATERPLFEGNFYGLGFDPNTNYINAATASGVNAAYAKRYQTDGSLVDSFLVGVFANGFAYRD